jgi:hypothetical protein
VLDALRRYQSQLPAAIRTCVPSSITTAQVLELIWKRYPNWNVPTRRGASEVIIEVLAAAYPCQRY